MSRLSTLFLGAAVVAMAFAWFSGWQSRDDATERKNLAPASRAGLSFGGKQVSVGGVQWKLKRNVIDAKLLGNRVFLLFDPAGYEPTYDVQTNNLEAFDLMGNRLWTVSKHPPTDGLSSYTTFGRVDELVVHNIAGFDCSFDAETGVLLNSKVAN